VINGVVDHFVFHAGPPGVPGADGLSGQKGGEGRDGIPGEPGQRGRPGDEGDTGVPGRPGIDGRPGAQGRPGEKGEAGALLFRNSKKIAVIFSQMQLQCCTASCANCQDFVTKLLYCLLCSEFSMSD